MQLFIEITFTTNELKYLGHYTRLIEKAQHRVLNDNYVEKHHIIPKCLGGLDIEENLIKLTPEEHYVAHQLLVKIFPKNPKIFYAAKMLCVKRSNKLYGWLKRKQSIPENNPMYGKHHTEETKQKIRLKHLGMKHTIQTKEKISKIVKGRLVSAETRNKLSIALTNRIITKDWRNRISASCKGRLAHNKGVPMTEEQKQKLRKPKPIISCPYCNKKGSTSNMLRWHFDNCKVKHI